MLRRAGGRALLPEARLGRLLLLRRLRGEGLGLRRGGALGLRDLEAASPFRRGLNYSTAKMNKLFLISAIPYFGSAILW